MDHTEVPYISANSSTSPIRPIVEHRVSNLEPSVNDDDLRYGLRFLSCPRSFWCLATRKWFLIIVSAIILIQGILHGSFNRSFQAWAIKFKVDNQCTDWIIVISKCLQGVLTILLIHANKKFNRMKSAAVCLALFAISCFFLYIPNWIHSSALHNSFIHPDHSEDSCWMALLVLLIFQNMLGLSSVFLLVQTVVYVDDHHDLRLSIILNGLVLALEQVSPYIGNALTLSMVSSAADLFGSYGWIILVGILIFFCMLLGMYPVYLDCETKMNCFNCNLDSSSHNPDLLSILYRIMTNHIVMCNIFVAVIFASALMNISLMENSFNMSRFAVPDDTLFSNPLPIQYILSVLTPLSMIVFIVFTASVITRYEMRAVNLTVFHVVAPVLLSLFFILLIFIGCDEIQVDDYVMNDTCKDCDCENVQFEPICVEELALNFFAPCYAGCSTAVLVNGTMVYTNCSNTESFLAYPGVCALDSCYSAWLSKETIQLAIRTLGSGAWLSHVINTMNLVHFSDRIYVLGLHLSLTGIIGCGFIRLVYKYLGDLACRYMSAGTCRLRDPDILSQYSLSLTIALLWLSAAGALLILYLINNYTKDYPESRNFCKICCISFYTHDLEANGDPNNNHELESVASEYIPIDYEFENEGRFLQNVSTLDSRDLNYMDAEASGETSV